MREGFVMRQVILLIAFVMGIFALLQTYLKSHAQEENLEREDLFYEKQLDSTREIFFYELAMLESYLMNGNMRAIENYFYETERGERIYQSYDYLEIFQGGESSDKLSNSNNSNNHGDDDIGISNGLDNIANRYGSSNPGGIEEREESSGNREVKSLGGYRISYMNPDLRDLRESRWDTVSFKVAKELEVFQGERSIFRVKIESGIVKSSCMVERAERKISCDPLEKMVELKALGEEL